MLEAYAFAGMHVNRSATNGQFVRIGRLGRRGNRYDFRVTPQPLEVVVGSRFWRKDVNQVVAIIRQHPFGILVSLDADRALAGFLQLCTDLFADGLNLSRIGARADDEEVGEGRDFTQIEDDYILGLFGFSGADSSQP